VSNVAQIFNLLYRRIAFGSASLRPEPFEFSKPSGLKIRDTADCKSALQPRRDAALIHD
jgi:hypothetical protein